MINGTNLFNLMINGTSTELIVHIIEIQSMAPICFPNWDMINGTNLFTWLRYNQWNQFVHLIKIWSMEPIVLPDWDMINGTNFFTWLRYDQWNQHRTFRKTFLLQELLNPGYCRARDAAHYSYKKKTIRVTWFEHKTLKYEDYW